MPRKLYTDIAIIECLEQYGAPMTAQEIIDLTGRNQGTISGRLSQMVSKGQVQVVNLGHMPRLYIKAPPQWTPAPKEVVSVQAVPIIDEEPDFSDPEDAVQETVSAPAKTVWSNVNDQWALIFGVHVTDADCELMVKLANRHVG